MPASKSIYGAGTGLIMIAAGWIGTLARVADPKLVTGAGAFLCLMAGLTLLATTRGVLSEFRRSEVYVEIADDNATNDNDADAVGAHQSALVAN